MIIIAENKVPRSELFGDTSEKVCVDQSPLLYYFLYRHSSGSLRDIFMNGREQNSLQSFMAPVTRGADQETIKTEQNAKITLYW